MVTLRTPVGDRDVNLKAIKVTDGTVPLLIKELDPAAIADTDNRPLSFPYGLLSYRIAVVPGGTATMEVEFSEEAPANGSYVTQAYTHEDGWHLNENILYLELDRAMMITWQDGGIGDADGVVNGIIVNP
jgi:hypothetical protein